MKGYSILPQISRTGVSEFSIMSRRSHFFVYVCVWGEGITSLRRIQSTYYKPSQQGFWVNYFLRSKMKSFSIWEETENILSNLALLKKQKQKQKKLNKKQLTRFFGNFLSSLKKRKECLQMKINQNSHSHIKCYSIKITINTNAKILVLWTKIMLEDFSFRTSKRKLKSFH